MIGQLRGSLVFRKSENIIIDVQGVGYEVQVTSSAFLKLPSLGSAVELKIYTHVRENQLQLYGFLTEAEKELFLLLLTVSGVGPKVASSVTSEIPPKEFSQVILSGNLQRLTSISGVGKKTAERIVLEIKEKVKKLSSMVYAVETPLERDTYTDLISALSNLGYKQMEVDKVLGHLKGQQIKEEKFEELLRRSLQFLRT